VAHRPDREGSPAVEKIKPVPWNGLYGKSEPSLFKKKPVKPDIEDKKQQPHDSGPDQEKRLPGGQQQCAEKSKRHNYARTPRDTYVQIVHKTAIPMYELSPWQGSLKEVGP
jgi:hypothetical protein